MNSFNNKFNILGMIGVGGLLALGTLLVVPITPISVHATCADGDTSEGCVASMASMDAEVTVGTSIAIAMDSKVTMDITPSSTGSVSAVSSKVQVMTNSIDGYALFMKADPELVNTSTVNDGAVVNSITNTSTTDTLSNMAENTYGYSISANQPSDTELMNSTYQPLDTTGTTPIRQTTSTSIGTSNTDYGYGEEYYLNLGVKVGTNLPAGTYAGTVTLSAVANPVTVRSMAGLTYMQDITHDICANTIEHYTKRLTDTRDGNKYWVAKLRDGNCWMTQNLALDITEAMASATGNSGLLNSNTTDIGYNANGELIDGIKYWNADSEYPPRVTDLMELSDTPASSRSWGGWKYDLLAIPTTGIVCATATSGAYNTARLGVDLGESCKMAGFVDVSGDAWSPTFTIQDGNFILPAVSDSLETTTYSGPVAINMEARTYDAHYLVGNYYGYNATTAGTGGSLVNANAPDSICPKGWQLPKAGNNVDIPGSLNSDSGTWYYLSAAYDGKAGVKPPVSLVSGGDLRSEYAVEIGNTGRYWSATSSDTTAYHAAINFNITDASRTALGKTGGVLVRCLAR